jgi:hypothetical protein
VVEFNEYEAMVSRGKLKLWRTSPMALCPIWKVSRNSTVLWDAFIVTVMRTSHTSLFDFKIEQTCIDVILATIKQII